MGFRGEDLTFGVEEEFFLVDQGGQLADSGPEVVGKAEDPDGEVQRELIRSQVESATGICHTAEEAGEQLTRLRGQLAEKSAGHGLRLLASATPILPESDAPALTPGDRYRRMGEHFGSMADVSVTAGCHVHVAIPDRETGVQVSNRTRVWLPVLLALTANSPFDRGVETGYRSWRQVLWSRWPSAGPPPMFTSLDHYESSIEAMLRSGAMLDRAMLYWDIRLADRHPTLEFRIADVAGRPEEAALLAVLVRGLVNTALDDSSPTFATPDEILRANLWRAARDGLGGSCLHPDSGTLMPVSAILDDLLRVVTPALRATGDLDFARHGLAHLLETGCGADRQLAAARSGSLTDVVDLMCAS